MFTMHCFTTAPWPSEAFAGSQGERYRMMGHGFSGTSDAVGVNVMMAWAVEDPAIGCGGSGH